MTPTFLKNPPIFEFEKPAEIGILINAPKFEFEKRNEI